jgi:hypothetical protein
MGFNIGDTATGAEAMLYEIQLDGEWERFCVNNVDENLNPQTMTWKDICSITSQTALTGIDPDWASTIVVRYGSAAAVLLKRRYDGLGNLQNIPVRITNLLLEEQITFNGMISALSLAQAAENLVEATFTLKVFSGSPITKHFEKGDYDNIAFTLLDRKTGLGVPSTRVTLTGSDGSVYIATSMVDGTGMLPLIPKGGSPYSVEFSNFPTALMPEITEDLVVDGEGTSSTMTWYFATADETITVVATKVWNGDVTGGAPEITLRLLDGLAVVGTQVLTPGNTVATFNNIVKRATSSFSMQENSVQGWVPAVTGDIDTGFTVTNSEAITVTVKKLWTSSGLTEFPLAVFDLMEGSNIVSTVSTTKSDGVEEDLVFPDQVLASKTYTVVERTITDSVNSGSWAHSITGDQTTGFTVNNTYTP